MEELQFAVFQGLPVPAPENLEKQLQFSRLSVGVNSQSLKHGKPDEPLPSKRVSQPWCAVAIKGIHRGQWDTWCFCPNRNDPREGKGMGRGAPLISRMPETIEMGLTTALAEKVGEHKTNVDSCA